MVVPHGSLVVAFRFFSRLPENGRVAKDQVVSCVSNSRENT
jgi:hypothetical protein